MPSNREILIYFLQLGFTGFGGPMALIAVMQRDLVERRKWMEREAFARAFALIKAMPGPVAFQTAVFLGRIRGGWKGGTLAAIGLTIPPFLMMVLLGIFYDRWRGLSGAGLFLDGMQAAALGVVLASLKGLASSHVKKAIFWLLAAVAVTLTWWHPEYEPLVIVCSGICTALVALRAGTRSARNKGPSGGASLFFLIRPQWRAMNTAYHVTQFGSQLHESVLLSTSVVTANFIDLSWSCFKAGAFVFGSGLAIVPLMESEFVQRLGWLSHQEFMDALAFGQITPGPVVITATFIGFKVLGVLGATVATGAIFAAPFFHMMTWFPSAFERLSKLTWTSAFLTGAISAVVGSLLATSVHLALTIENKLIALPLLALAFAITLFSSLPVWLIIPGTGLAAWAAHFVL